MANRKAKDDQQIAAILDQHIRFTTGYSDSKLAKERTRILEYYDGTLPLPNSKGNSKYVSQDVFESVEALKATILEVFSTGKQIVSFTPSGADDVELARIATEYTAFQVFRKNPGLDVLTDVLDDGLLARVGVCQFSWETYDETEDEQIGPADMNTLAAHPAIAHPKTTVNDIEDHGDGTYTANVTKTTEKGCVSLEVVPPEDFGITARAKDIKSAKLVYRRQTRTKGELLAEGYPEKLIDQCQSDPSEMLIDSEKTARFDQLDVQRSMSDDTIDLDNSSNTYLLHHCYAKLDVDGTGIPKLWYVVKCGNIIMKKERVSLKPFAAFIPLRKAHSFYGNSYAGKVVPIQNVRTVLTRTILDHAVITNSPRYKVVKGGLMNPKELMDNRIGGIVNVTRPDGVLPLEQAPLNPFVFQTIQMMDQNKEDTTGVSRLSKGLNPDAISTQNSHALVEDLVALADRRAKLVARRFANFLEELYLGIYQLILDHQDYTDAIEVAGNWVQVDPSKWRDRTLVEADIKVGFGEMEREAQELVVIDQYLSQQGPLYGPKQKYNVLSKALIKKGYKDVSNYLIPPEQQQPTQPDPLEMAKAQALQTQAAAAKATAQAALLRVQFEQQKWQHTFDLQTQKEVGSHAVKSDALDLKERQQTWNEHVDAEELALQHRELDIAEKEQSVQASMLAKPNG